MVTVDFELALPDLVLEAGARVTPHLVRGWIGSDEADARALARITVDAPRGQAVTRTQAELSGAASRRARARLDPRTPTVVLVHALTGDAAAGGPGGWWSTVIGEGAALDPARVRVLSFNLLGSCYGTSGPGDDGFPTARSDLSAQAPAVEKGAFDRPESHLPATITTWDQARSILLALDALGIEDVALLAGGSLGGMVALALATLAPERFARLASFAACAAAPSWIVAHNHIARQAILADPGFPHAPWRGLAIARQLGMLSYRAERGLDAVQGARAQVAPARAWSPRAPYRIQTWLEHQGDKLTRRFDARAYLALLGAMDHHDLDRPPPSPWPGESWSLGEGPWTGAARIRASTLAVGIDSDMLFLPHHARDLADHLTEAGAHARHAALTSAHGHDAFLIEWAQVDALLREGLALPVLARAA
jgi:homoserine O-acetyltransferase